MKRNAKERDSTVEYLFETANVDRISFVKSSVASLYATGRSSGYVWEISESKNQFVCVEDGFIDQKLIFEHPVTLSRTINQFLSKQIRDNSDLTNSENSNLTSFTRKSLRENWLNGEGNKHFPVLKLPDGTTFENPDLLKNSKELLEIFIAQNFPHKQDVLCVGGVFGIKNFLRDIENIIRPRLSPVEIFLDPKNMNDLQFRRYAPFIGSSILGSLSGYSDFYLSRKDYFDLMHLTDPPIKETNDMLSEEDSEARGTKRGKFSVVDRLFQ